MMAISWRFCYGGTLMGQTAQANLFPAKQTSNGERGTAIAWGEVAIGDICNLVNGRAFKPIDWTDVGLPIVRIQNLNDKSKPFNYYSRHACHCYRKRAMGRAKHRETVLRH